MDFDKFFLSASFGLSRKHTITHNTHTTHTHTLKHTQNKTKQNRTNKQTNKQTNRQIYMTWPNLAKFDQPKPDGPRHHAFTNCSIHKKKGI